MMIQELTCSLPRCLSIVLVCFDTEPDPHQKLLEERGHLVLPVHSLRTALESVRLYAFDLLVLGNGVSHADRLAIVERATQFHPRANILSLQASGSGELPHASAYVEHGDDRAFEFALDSFEYWRQTIPRAQQH